MMDLNVTVSSKKPPTLGERVGEIGDIKPHVVIASLSDALRFDSTAKTVAEHSIALKPELMRV
jgi:hypothetical protein